MTRAIASLLLAGAGLLAQMPSVENARMETRASTGLQGELSRALKQSGPLWLGYSFQSVKGLESGCWDTGRRSKLRLEGGGPAMVLLRVESGKVQKVRFTSIDCTLDAGGLPFTWLTGVPAAESVNVLKTLPGDGPIGAIAHHDDPSADAALEQLVQPSSPVETRKKAAFWLGVARGSKGVAVLQRMVRADPSTKVREHVVFALSQSKDPAGMQTVMRLAKEDSSPEVRSKALFWMAQAAGKKAAGSIEQAVENDPDTQVKKQAVFALTQLPESEGVPALIRVATTNKNPAVRKQAFFWLGQSKDERAAKFLESVLTKQ